MTTLTPYDEKTGKGDVIIFSADPKDGESFGAQYRSVYAANKGIDASSVDENTVITADSSANLDGLTGQTFEVKREWCKSATDKYHPKGEAYVGFNEGRNRIGLEKCRNSMQFPGSTTAQEHWVDENGMLHNSAFATVPLLAHHEKACFDLNKVASAVDDATKVVKVFVRGFLYSVYTDKETKEKTVSRVWHVDFIIEDKKAATN